MKIFALLCCTFVFTCVLHAQALEWDKMVAPIDVPVGSTEKVSGEFHFKNTSDQIVRIKQVPASCGCVVSKPTKQEYAPGESGTIPFTYSPKKRWGTRAYQLYVITDEVGSKPYQLAIHITEHNPAVAIQK